MGDPKISSSLPPNIPATDVDSVAFPELPSQPEPTGSGVRQVAGNSAETINQPGTETNDLTATISDYEKEGLRDSVSPFDEADPGIFSDLGAQMAQPAETPDPDGELFNAGVMQFASPIALPNAVKGVVPIKLTPEQAQAKAELEKSPVWTILSDAEKNQVTKSLSKVSGPKLQQELDKLKERFQAIETLSKRPGWSQISTAQQQKIADQILKLSGNPLKNEMTKLAGKFDTIEKMSQHGAWSVLDTDQKAKLADPVFNLAGDKLTAHVKQTQDRLDALSTLSKEPSWKDLGPAHQKTIADHLLKASHPNLKQTTQNVKETMDFIVTLKNNKVDAPDTLNKLLNLETKKPAAFSKMSANFAEAKDQINAAKDKQAAATDIRDMFNLAIDRTVGSKKGADIFAERGDIAGRLLRQYKNDPADFHKFRDLLKQEPNARFVAHWHHKDIIGIGIPGTKGVTDADWKNAKIPAGEETRYKHAMGNLLEREGKYDTMNAYDDGIISIGVRQWTTHQGSIVEPLEAFRKANPTKFAQMLPGISITTNPNTVTYNGKPLTTSKGQDVKAILSNLTQSEYMELSVMFNKLGKDPDFQTAQLQVGINRINTVLAMPVGSHKIGDYVKSDRALGHIISYDPGRPAFINKAFADAVKDVATDFGLTKAAPSRQELLDQLKLKIEGDKAKKIEPDKDFIQKLEQKYGKDVVDKLKTDAGRADFLEKRLTTAFRDNFLEANDKTFKSPRDTARFRERFNATERYYDKV